MSLNHRYLWSTRFVLDLMRTSRLSERASFIYFLAIMIFDWFQFTVIATTPTPRISPWSNANAWITFAVTIFGLLYLYGKNGREGGKFMFRYFPLSVTVGWKFVVAMLFLTWLIPLVLVEQGDSVVGWAITSALFVANVAMFWRIGFHLGALSREEVV